MCSRATVEPSLEAENFMVMIVYSTKDRLTASSKVRGMETLLINEDLVSPFKFWRDNQVQQGMMYRSELFYCASKFKNHQRQQAFDFAWMLSCKGAKQVIITVTRTYYTVWIGLRAPEGVSLEDDVSLETELVQLLINSAHVCN